MYLFTNRIMRADTRSERYCCIGFQFSIINISINSVFYIDLLPIQTSVPNMTVNINNRSLDRLHIKYQLIILNFGYNEKYNYRTKQYSAE